MQLAVHKYTMHINNEQEEIMDNKVKIKFLKTTLEEALDWLEELEDNDLQALELLHITKLTSLVNENLLARFNRLGKADE